MKVQIPIKQLLVAMFTDAIEIFATPIIGYFLAIPFDIYLYKWAKGYLDLGSVHGAGESAADFRKRRLDLRNKIKSSLIFRIVLEYIPIINFLPISTIFVLLAYRDKVNMHNSHSIQNLDQVTNAVDSERVIETTATVIK